MLFVEKLFLWFLFYSFCGWVYESILVSILERRPVNRGFLNGPLCPIYGAGAVGAVVVLGQVHNPLVVFLLSMVGASILEYVTSWVMEALFHARWWDYSDYKFNLNGRICLLGAFVFGVGGVLITSVIQPQVAGVTDRLPLPAIHWLCGVLFVLTLIDLVVTVCGIMHFENSLDNLMAAMTHYGDAMKVAVSDVTGKMSESWKSGKEEPGRLYDRSYLERKDKYSSFLGGNQPLCVLENPAITDGSKLLLIRDSYSDSLAPFLAQRFSEVHLVDLRYCHASVADYMAEQGIDTAVVLYSVSNFLTDRNLIYLAPRG